MVMYNLQILAISLLLLTGLFIFLSFRIIGMRRKLRVPYSHQDEDKMFMPAISAQRNFIDYTAFTLMLMIVMVLLEVNSIIFAVLNLLFVIGRFSHSYGILHLEQKQEKPNFKGRARGMQLTFLTIITSVLVILGYAFYRL